MACPPKLGPGPGAVADSWSASQLAQDFSSYYPNNVLQFGSVYMLPKPQNGFTGPVMSFQTRSRNWLQRIDEAPSGVLIDTFTDDQTLEDGTTLNVTTVREQIKDAIVTTITTQNLGTPSKTSTKVLTVNKSGQSTLRTIEANTENGIRNTVESVTLRTQPPNTENIQPAIVKTVDGVIHYQFLLQNNPEWAGGDKEGTTITQKQEQIQPGSLVVNGQVTTTDSFGNPILSKITDETVTRPTGEVETTHIVQTGFPGAGTTTTDLNSAFNGIQTITTKTINYPDGSQSITTTTANDLGGGNWTEDTLQNNTDIYGQLTTINTVKNAVTSLNSTTGLLQTIITTTETTTKGPVTTNRTKTETRNNFEDAIAPDKVKVYMIQEFTASAWVDALGLAYLQNIAWQHAQGWAKIELYGQMLANMDLSYDLRQSLLTQYWDAVDQVAPVPFIALGQNWLVVFAPSAAAFRPSWIVGTLPQVFEVQLILQQRSDLINGTIGSFLG